MANIQGLRDKYKQIEGERFFAELFTKNEYQPTLVVKADVVVDVGALAGEFCAYIYDKAGVIYAIEPYGSHYAELEENVKEFNMDKVKPFNLALSDINGMGNLEDDEQRGGQRLVRDKSDTSTAVETKTLATFMKDQGIEYIDILKIDIEGGEIQVFGSEDFEDVIDKISFIVGEHFTNEIHDQLSSHGFSRRDYMHNVIYERLPEGVING